MEISTLKFFHKVDSHGDIDINLNLKYPIERNQISNAFHYFLPWAGSGGTYYSDWYMNETGYRN